MDDMCHKTKTDDKNVRHELISLLTKHRETSGVIEELEVARGRARVDVVQVAKGQIHAYEIKSDIDTLSRLPRQIRYYNQVFSTVTLVVGSEHAVKAMYLVPDWWGVIVAKLSGDTISLNQVRQTKQNENIDYKSITAILKKDELIKMINKTEFTECLSGASKQTIAHEAQKTIEVGQFIEMLAAALLDRSTRSFTEAKVVH